MAKKAAAKETTEDETKEAEAPILDLNNAQVKKLIKTAKARGFVTYDELNSILPSEEFSSEQIEDVMTQLSEMGINVIENEEEEDAANDDEEPKSTALAKKEEKGGSVVTTNTSSSSDRTDDPVRMYLREMGSVELLSREGEIAIAKRIEAGRETMIR
ncbi:MAG: RNA polymerase sigma factor region1.1 domain-containing protein, partial [Pseudomonadota bacterium]